MDKRKMVVLAPANVPDPVVQQAIQMAADLLAKLPQGPARLGGHWPKDRPIPPTR